jgi:hypothetical protein
MYRYAYTVLLSPSDNAYRVLLLPSNSSTDLSGVVAEFDHFLQQYT